MKFIRKETKIMRLYHPRTLQIFASRKDIPKRYSCSAWSEIFKWKASGKSHPKMFIDDDYDLGAYLHFAYDWAVFKGCKLDFGKIKKLDIDMQIGFNHYVDYNFDKYFDDNYLFSDACSLYFKGINIFPDIFGDEWRKYVPVESHKEIKRQVDEYLNK